MRLSAVWLRVEGTARTHATSLDLCESVRRRASVRGDFHPSQTCLESGRVLQKRLRQLGLLDDGYRVVVSDERLHLGVEGGRRVDLADVDEEGNLKIVRTQSRSAIKL